MVRYQKASAARRHGMASLHANSHRIGPDVSAFADIALYAK